MDRMARELVSQGLFRMDEINFWCIGVADSDPPHIKVDQRLALLLCLQRTHRTYKQKSNTPTPHEQSFPLPN